MLGEIFRKLWAVALQEGEKMGEKPGDVFAPLGLYLMEPEFEN
jgi:hypothetical protein